jgi:hypothetical protein
MTNHKNDSSELFGLNWKQLPDECEQTQADQFDLNLEQLKREWRQDWIGLDDSN